ncbi:unnamed protein product, partial [Rotaria sp. Silwood1]
MQGGIPSPVLFNIVFDFIIRQVLEEASLTGFKLAYDSYDFYHDVREKYEEFDILTLMYADDLVAMCNSINDLQKFILVFEKVTQKYGLIMSEVDQPDINFTIKNQKIEITDSFCYLGCWLSRGQQSDKKMESRLTIATTAFNMLRNVI